MIFESQVARGMEKQGTFRPQVPWLQRKCACGGTPGPLGDHVPKVPVMRPVEGELVEGFSVTPAMCYCVRSIGIEEERAKKGIGAFRSCLLTERTVDGLYTCAKIKVYGSKEAAEKAA